MAHDMFMDNVKSLQPTKLAKNRNFFGNKKFPVCACACSCGGDTKYFK